MVEALLSGSLRHIEPCPPVRLTYTKYKYRPAAINRTDGMWSNSPTTTVVSCVAGVPLSNPHSSLIRRCADASCAEPTIRAPLHLDLMQRRPKATSSAGGRLVHHSNRLLNRFIVPVLPALRLCPSESPRLPVAGKPAREATILQGNHQKVYWLRFPTPVVMADPDRERRVRIDPYDESEGIKLMRLLQGNVHHQPSGARGSN